MKLDINDLTLGQIKELVGHFNGKSDHPYQIGKAYFIRTVTMHHIGIIRKVLDNEIIMSDASWIADSGRFSDCLMTGELNEVEPFPDEVIVGRNAIIDATIWNHPLPRNKK
jgi:hypothetical protein